MITIYNNKHDPIGIKCKCGEINMYGEYVNAHWSQTLSFTCPECGKYSLIKYGEIISNGDGTR